MADSPSAEAAPLNKSISFIRRKSGTTPDQFKAKWLGEHGPGSLKIQGIEGFVLGEVMEDAGRARSRAGGASELDGIAESWQSPGINRAEQAKADPFVRDWLGAAPTYIGAINIFVTREHIFAPPRRGGHKVITLIFRKPEQTHGDFVRHMLEVHGPLSMNVPGLRGYVLSEIVRRPAMSALPEIPGLGEVDMIGHSWMSTDPAEQTPDSDGRSAWLEDGKANFGSFMRYVTLEHDFIAPPYAGPAKASV
jgi:hypothetical protein